jgi:hypothetical protein
MCHLGELFSESIYLEKKVTHQNKLSPKKKTSKQLPPIFNINTTLLIPTVFSNNKKKCKRWIM